MLKEIARIMHGFREGSDVACRYGGEEFVVVMPETDAEQARKKFEHFRRSVSGLSLHYNGEFLPPLTVSVGIAIYPDHATNGSELLKQADDALYAAKKSGRDRVEVAGSTGRQESSAQAG